MVAETTTRIESVHTLAAQDRAMRDVVMVEFAAPVLEEFIQFLNDSHIVKGNYLYTFTLHYADPTQATLHSTIRTFNEM